MKTSSEHPSPVVMVIDDDPENQRIIGEILDEPGYQLRFFQTGSTALESALADPPDIILLDLQLPDTNGLEVFNGLQSNAATKDIPVIFITDSFDHRQKTRVFEEGGAAYLVRPVHPAELLARVRMLLAFKDEVTSLKDVQSDLEKQLEERSEKLLENEEKFRRIVTTVNEGIVVTDEKLKVVFVNDAMTHIARSSAEDLIGRSSTDFIPEESRKDFRNRISRRKKGIAEQYQFQVRLLDGEKLWMRISSAPVIDRDGQFQGLVLCFTDIDRTVREQEKLSAAYEEIRSLKRQLESDNVYLQEEIKQRHDYTHIIGNSDAINYALFRLEQVAETDSTVIVLGETGTGKELFVRALHSRSRRSDRPLVKVDCAAMTEQLIESELFGHARGAFTGAEKTRIGRFELADKSTLFLDEIGELPMTSQAKLLRFLEEGEFERVGDSRTLKSDVRIIAATNRDVSELVQHGTFRRDLWHRLKVFPITLPPLRKRKEDIPLLVKHFVDQIGRRIGKEIKRIPAGVMDELAAYEWPGNVRELYNFLERSIILTPGPSLDLAERLVDLQTDEAPPEKLSHAEMEVKHLLRVLEQTKWVVEGPKGAARILKMHPNTLRYRMKKHGIARPS